MVFENKIQPGMDDRRLVSVWRETVSDRLDEKGNSKDGESTLGVETI